MTAHWLMDFEESDDLRLLKSIDLMCSTEGQTIIGDFLILFTGIEYELDDHIAVLIDKYTVYHTVFIQLEQLLYKTLPALVISNDFIGMLAIQAAKAAGCVLLRFVILYPRGFPGNRHRLYSVIILQRNKPSIQRPHEKVVLKHDQIAYGIVGFPNLFIDFCYIVTVGQFSRWLI